MKERPIIFSTDMVKAILDGRKTMTRRVIKPQPEKIPNDVEGDEGAEYWYPSKLHQTMIHLAGWQLAPMKDCCPYGQVGDRLWVRETFCYHLGFPCGYLYKADGGKQPAEKWKPSIHMPRWASRIDRIIAMLRVERLLDISGADARAEGFNSIGEFLTYWDILNKKRGYGTDMNPWNWVIGW